MRLRKKKTLMEQAREQAAEYVETVKPQVEHAVASARAAALPLITEAKEKATPVLAEAREQAIARLIEETQEKGGDAIIAMRFDTSDFMTNATEICAYGTAVKIAKR